MAETESVYQNHPDLKRLRKSLQRAGDEFALFFVECNLPALRDELAEALAADMLPPPILVDISLLTSDTQQLDELIALQVGDTPAPIFLFGLEQWLPTLSEDKLRATVQQLNWRRNRYARLQRPLVIWLPRYALDILAEHTPDFYDWYSGVFVFQASAEQQALEEGNNLKALLSDSKIHAADRLSIEEKRRWLHTLRELLQEHTEPDTARANLLANLATLLRSLGDYTKALDYLQQALVVYRDIGDKSGEGRMLNNISQIYTARSDYVTALVYLEKSLAFLQEIGDKSGEGATLNNISQIYKARGNYTNALGYLEKSLTIQQEIGNKSGEGVTLNNMATLAHARGDFVIALAYMEKALAIQQEIGDKSGEGVTLSNMATLAHARGDFVIAQGYLEKSRAIQREIGDKSGEGTTLNNISQIYSARGDYVTALAYLEKSLAIRQQIGDMAGMCATLFNMAHTHLQNGEQDKAMQTWAKAYVIAKKTNLAQMLDELKKLALQLDLPGGLAGWDAIAQQENKQEIRLAVSLRTPAI